MMTLTNSSRKRECSEDTDYMPVTKRMNSLHIDSMTNGFASHLFLILFNTNLLDSLNDINEQLIGRQIPDSEAQTRDNCLIRNQSHCHSINCINNIENCFHVLGVYCPQLDSNSNPIYYEPNRILFEAHQQRVYRMANRHIFFRKS